MLDIKKYFSENEIIHFVAKLRAKSAKDVHDNQFLRNVSKLARKPFNPNKRKDIYDFVPPRNCWIRLKKHERTKYNDSLQINTVQIERSVKKYRSKVKRNEIDEPKWHKKLNSFIEDIQNSVINEDYEIDTPELIPQIKDKKKNTYRPICLFSLKDRFIISQTARYFTCLFDPLFYNNSYAFREQKPGQLFNHHKAVEDIINYRKKANTRIYAAECDIKKFYDSISHDTIISCFNSLKDELIKKGAGIDEIAEKIFFKYLECYTFNHTVYQNQKQLLENKGIHNGEIPWVEEQELCRVKSDPKNDKIGVPQGGALSCLIANIVLHFADKKIISGNYRKLFYARFCDDMILLHTNKKQCQRAFDDYIDSLKSLKLIEHQPEDYKKYSKEFWGIKTKKPYVWGKNNPSHRLAKKNVPWVAFVGYQVRYDGIVRIRKSSLIKELNKQVIETNKVLKSIYEKSAVKVNKRALKFRFMQRLISMSVGRLNNDGQSLCWTSGFRVLKNHKCLKSQLRKLDRNRAKQIARLKNKISHLGDSGKKSSQDIRVLPYYGGNYSYYHQFVNKKDE